MTHPGSLRSCTLLQSQASQPFVAIFWYVQMFWQRRWRHSNAKQCGWQLHTSQRSETVSPMLSQTGEISSFVQRSFDHTRIFSRERLRPHPAHAQGRESPKKDKISPLYPSNRDRGHCGLSPKQLPEQRSKM